MWRSVLYDVLLKVRFSLLLEYVDYLFLKCFRAYRVCLFLNTLYLPCQLCLCGIPFILWFLWACSIFCSTCWRCSIFFKKRKKLKSYYTKINIGVIHQLKQHKFELEYCTHSILWRSLIWRSLRKYINMKELQSKTLSPLGNFVNFQKANS